MKTTNMVFMPNRLYLSGPAVERGPILVPAPGSPAGSPLLNRDADCVPPWFFISVSITPPLCSEAREQGNGTIIQGSGGRAVTVIPVPARNGMRRGEESIRTGTGLI